MQTEAQLQNPFDPANILTGSWCDHPLRRLARPLTNLIPGLRGCRRQYSALPQNGDAGTFARSVLDALQITVTIDSDALSKLPGEGGAIVIANHPFGGLDGLILIDQLRRLRPDVRFMANQLLERIPQLREVLLPVEILDQKAGGRLNIAPLRRGIKWVKDGGMLVIFPAGEVSHLNLRQGAVIDPPWSASVARLIQRCKVPVYPAFFSGRNSRAFQAIGLIHPMLRTAMLPHELLNKRGAKVALRFGSGIRPKRFCRYDEPQQLIDYLRLQTYLLGSTARNNRETNADDVSVLAPIFEAVPGKSLRQELSRLPEQQRLLQAGSMEVWQAQAGQMPLLLSEIGRLREETFRSIGEGTGNPLDLDRYDEYYRHLFLWNRDSSEIVGAYRIGTSDTILAESGVSGLYTSELFRYDADFFTRLGPALELGRSFVRTSYQRSYTPLLLLWQGIGSFLVQNPRYRTLFGPVSITNDYSDIARRIMANALWEKLADPELTPLVAPRTPFPIAFPRLPGCSLESARALMTDLDDVDALINDLEPEQKGIPVLLRHYLNLGGRVLALNLDHNFQSALDALLYVDLDAAPARIIERYMGKSGRATFMQQQPCAETLSA